MVMDWRVPLARSKARVRDSAVTSLRCRNLLFAPDDAGLEFLADGGIEGRLLVSLQQPLPDRVGATGTVEGAGLAPGLEVAPVRQQRLVEGVLEPLERVDGAEEMAAGA